MRRFLFTAMAVMLCSCGSHKTVVPALSTQVIYKPVLKSCVPDDLQPAPAYPDTNEALLGAPSAAERYRLLFAGRMLRSQRLLDLEAITQGCK